MWRPFSKYHYLDHDLHQAARQFVGVWNGEAIAHTGIIQFPMRKGWKRVHRLVVMPDYQGIGVGVKFINAVAAIVAADGHNLNLTTTTPALVAALKRADLWSLVRRGVVKQGDISSRARMGPGGSLTHLARTGSQDRPTFSFDYKP